MSISNALSNAVSGLTVASRGVEIVSSNVANATTEGYAARELSISARTVSGAGGGVQVNGVVRRVDMPLVHERRGAQSSLAHSDTLAKGLSQLENLLGDPTVGGSLSDLVAQLSSDLITAASRPDSISRLDVAAHSAGRVADFLREASSGIQDVRQAADRSIASDVETLNASLTQIEELDNRITQLSQRGRDVSSLLDERQLAVDRISSIIPVRESDRAGGQIALYSAGGATLYDGRAALVEFSPHPSIQADLSAAAGDLSGITINGVEYSLDHQASKLQGGSLHANLLLRDEAAAEAQSALDSFARDLIERFQDPALDTTLVAGDAGLFTDRGSAFAAIDEVGVAGRIALNGLVDPDEGGEVWRLRAGLGAAAPGDVGDANLLNGLQSTLSEGRVTISGPIAGSVVSTSEFAAEILSLTSARRQDADRTVAYETSRYDTLREAELSGGVDTDDEMRNLLLLEQAYTANARVIQTLDELMGTLLRI